MSHDEMIEVLRAARDGKSIEARHKNKASAAWGCVYFPSWDFNTFDYRVKREPREWQVAVFNGKVIMPVVHPCETPYEIVTVREVI